MYSGPPLEPRPQSIAELAPSELEPVEHELHIFMVRVFAWIMGALLISAFFASYSDLWDESAVPILIGKTLLAFTGGMFVLAFVISRKVAKMLPSVAMATLIAYARFQGILFGLTYRAAYHASLAPYCSGYSLPSDYAAAMT